MFCQMINDMFIVFPLDKKKPFAIHYRTSIWSLATMANSSSEKVTALL